MAKATPDGHTLLMGITALAQLPAMMAKMPFDPLKDLVPVIEVARSNSFLVVPADSLASNFRQFVAITKATPRRYRPGHRLLPDVPTFAELGFKDFEPYGWFGLFMPGGGDEIL